MLLGVTGKKSLVGRSSGGELANLISAASLSLSAVELGSLKESPGAAGEGP